MAGQPQENPWTQQGQGYYPPYEQQPQQYEQQQYEQTQPAPAGYEPQPAIYEQPPGYAYPGHPQQQPGHPQHPGQPQQPGHPQHAGQPQPPGQPQLGQLQQQERQEWGQWEATQRQPRPQIRNQGQKKQTFSSGHRGFVSSLFDFGFTSFVTPKIIKALYAVVTAWTILWAILLLFIGNNLGHIAGLLFVLIIVDPLLILLSLGLLRVALEFFMITFRMQEDLKALRERAGSADGEDTVVARVPGPDA